VVMLRAGLHAAQNAADEHPYTLYRNKHAQIKCINKAD